MEPMLTADTPLKRCLGVLAEQVGGETVVLDPSADRYVRLNATGGWVFERLAEPATPAGLASDMIGQLGAPPERALDDVLAFAEDVLLRGLIERAA